MNTKILELLKNKRNIVEEQFGIMVREDTRDGSYFISSKKFFFQVVYNHFDEFSTIMTNKCLKSEYKFNTEFWKAIDKAKYACAKPAREANRIYFPNYK